MNAFQQYLVDTETTVADFAASIGRAPSTLWRQVRGERNPTLGVAVDVERGTGGKILASEFLAICVAARREVIAAADAADAAAAAKRKRKNAARRRKAATMRAAA